MINNCFEKAMKLKKPTDYVLKPKVNTASGVIWIMSPDQLNKGGIVKVKSVDGYETMVDINNYTIYR